MDLVDVTIIHGTMSSPESNWFPWLASELSKLGVKVNVPKFPTPNGQNLKSWLEVFDQNVGAIGPSSILIGHSIGAALALRVLERLTKPIQATFLTAGFVGLLGIPEFDRLIKTFFERDFDWGKIRSGSKTFRLYSGDNDPYVALDLGRELAGKLRAELEIVVGGGHLNSEAGFNTFPKLLRDLQKIIC